MAQTTFSGLSQRTTYWAEANHLAHAEPMLCLAKYGLAKPIPMNKSDSVKFRRPVPFASVHGSPLAEGVTPAAKAMTYEDVTVALVQYGDLYQITDKVADMAEDPVLKDATMLTGEQNGETVERVIWGAITGGTNVFYSNGSAPGSVNTPISLGKQRKVTRFLKAQKGKKVTSKVSSSVNFNTESIAPAYLAFGHTDLENDIRAMTGFVPTENYGGGMTALEFEIGKVEDVRYILTPTLVPKLYSGSTTVNGMVATNDPGNSNTPTVDIYPLIYVAKEAYGLVTLKGKGQVEMFVHQPGKADKSDPLGQRGYVGWKTYCAAKILNESWVCRVEVAATAL